MREARVSIGQVKRDISELVNRVAYGDERVVLTSRGKPKAALVSIEDYRRLQQEEVEARLRRWEAWKAENDKLTADILARREGRYVDVDEILRANREDLESRDDWIISDH
ncbi:MAG TPA: type II toxin-antitoxin system Phd/YefM family antitoxin [Chloroflexota bacterium]|nr:type II toxin-antitoxin system Phd/YefM family antitoxin [Chloroflexota bacterium]